MNTIPRKHAKLANRLVLNLRNRNWTLEEIASFLAAQATHGILRENTPKWLDETHQFLADHDAVDWDALRKSIIGDIVT